MTKTRAALSGFSIGFSFSSVIAMILGADYRASAFLAIVFALLAIAYKE